MENKLFEKRVQELLDGMLYLQCPTCYITLRELEKQLEELNQEMDIGEKERKQRRKEIEAITDYIMITKEALRRYDERVNQGKF